MYSSSFRLTNRDIDLAFEARHLFIVCQPKLSLADGAVIGAEAYVRWDHPDYGLLPPGLFLSFFERRERSAELTRYVASAAADAVAAWSATGQHWPLSINLGAADLADIGLPGALDGIMTERGLDPALLALEVPEGAFARHGDAASRTIRELRRLGFRTALDGGGAVIVPDDVVSLEFFDEVKIGGGAIIQFASRLKQSGLGFVGRRVALAASRGLAATAVGVEDRTTLDALSALGFTAAQGAHLGRPAVPVELIGWQPPVIAIEPAEEAEEDVLLLTEPLADNAIVNDAEHLSVVAAAAPQPAEEFSWEEVEFHIPGEEVRAVAWRIDRVCLFPDRYLVALIRRPRRLPHMRKAKLPSKPAPVKSAVAKAEPPKHKQEQRKPAPRPRREPRHRAPAGLVTRPSLVQLALGF